MTSDNRPAANGFARLADRATLSARRRTGVILPFLVAVVLSLGIWEACVSLFSIPEYLLPAPTDVLRVLKEQWGVLTMDALFTLGEAATGFALGMTAAFLLGSIFANSLVVERAVAPVFVALQAIPLVAIAPLLIIWFGNGFSSKVVMAALICFFPMVINTAAGLRNVQPEAVELMEVLGATRWQTYVKLRIPASLPFLFSGMKVGATLSVIGAVVSELAGAGRGIGYQILISSYRMDTPTMFAAILFAAATGVVFYALVGLLERLVVRNGS